MIDVLCVGAGCAGLSLAWRLRARDVVLIDPREEYGRDRTWCFWNVVDHPFEHLTERCGLGWRQVDHVPFELTQLVQTCLTRAEHEHLLVDAHEVNRAPAIERQSSHEPQRTGGTPNPEPACPI